MELGEEELIKRAKDGDETAFGFLVDRYKGAVHALAYRKLGDYHEAEDITQEVFIKAYQKLHTLRDPRNFAGWLYVITANCCRMHLRGRYRKSRRTISLDQVSDEQWNALSLRRHAEEKRRQLVHDAIAQLSEGDRTVITLHYMGGMSCKEIARFMGTSVGAIKDRLYRARKRLKEEMIEMMRVEFAEHKLEANFTVDLIQVLRNLRPSISPRRINRIIPLGVATAAFILTIGLGLFWELVPQVEMWRFEPGPSQEQIQVRFMPYTAKGLNSPGPPVQARSHARVIVRRIRIPSMGTSLSSKRMGSRIWKALSEKGRANSLFAAAENPDRITVTGKVLKDNIPVQNAEIYLMGKDAKAARLVCSTDVDGSFRFEMPRPDEGRWGEISLVARHPLYSLGWKRLSKEEDVKGITIRLYEPGRVSGTVKDESGNPVQGAEVKISWLSAPDMGSIGGPVPGFTVKTDENGRFLLNNLPRGSKIGRLDIVGRGYARETQFAIQAGAEGISFTLKREGRIEGRITYGDTGEPAKGIGVNAQGLFPIEGWGEAETDEKGRYLIANLPPGLYNVFIDDLPGWTAVARSHIEVEEGKTVKNIDLKLVKGGFIIGRVTERDTGKPIPNCGIGFYDAARPEPQAAMHSAYTDKGGYYRFRAAPGKAKVYIYSTPEGYVRSYQSKYVNVVEGETVLGVDFQLQKGIDLKGKVLTPDGEPVAGAKITDRLGWGEIYAVSDENGDFTLSGLVPGKKLSLKAELKRKKLRGYVEVEAQPGVEVEIPVDRYETTVVFGRVVDPEGNPIPNAKIDLTRWDRKAQAGIGSSAAISDGSGRFEIRGLIVGDEYRISASAKGFISARTGMFVAEANMPEQRIVLHPQD
jgi:RNA polymerase sigma factor (sigma-70 family)